MITLIIITILAIEMMLSPRLDYTKEKRLLLWYGRRNRKYVILF